AAKLNVVADRLAEQGRAEDAPPELNAASAAIVARDAGAYSDALDGLAEVEREQADEAECEALAQRLREGHPALAKLVLSSYKKPLWTERLEGWDDAWAWARAHTFFLHQRQPGREQQLEAELADTVGRLRAEVASLAAVRAWGHCLR